jgi:hypothetical protein
VYSPAKHNFNAAIPRRRLLDTSVQSIIEEQHALVDINYDIRNQHIYVPGKTRHGKSTLLHEMALQDIENGAGVCVIDPKGNLARSLLNWIPESRQDDCIYIDPANPIPIDIFDYQGPREKQTIVGELKHIITKGVNAEHATLMNSMMNDLIYTLFDANEHGGDASFIDIHDFLAYDSRREAIMKFVKNPKYKERWNEKNINNPRERMPTITRMSDFTSSEYLQVVLGYAKPPLNLSWVMDNRKILLLNLGGIDEPTRLLAILVLAKIHQLMKRRWNIENEDDLIPFHLYVDEFGFFQTKDMAEMLSFDGGYGLRMVIGNQFVSQLDGLVWDAIDGNVNSYIIFHVGPKDASAYKDIAWVTSNLTGERVPVDIANLPRFRALYAVSGQPHVVKDTPPPPPAPTPEQLRRAKEIKDSTIRTFGPDACKPAPVSHTSRDETEKPKPEATLPHDAGKGPGTPAPQRVLRPHDKPARHATKEPDSH